LLLQSGRSRGRVRIDAQRMSRCLESVGEGFTIPRLQRCLGPDVAVGAMRASIGLANNRDDIHRALDVIASFA
jgi:selenocysteine lyase/cysteine desulfurase